MSSKSNHRSIARMIDWLQIQLHLPWPALWALLEIGIGRARLGSPGIMGSLCLPALFNCLIIAAKTSGLAVAY